MAEEQEDKIPPSENTNTRPAHPVDTGWAWVVLTASCMMMFLIIGIGKSFGIFFIEFLKEFEASVSSTSLITSVQTAAYCVTAAPVLTWGVSRVSSRGFIMFGVTAVSLGYGLSSLATNLQFMYFSQSVLIGTGMACLFGPNLINIGKYFDKKRGLANGILFSFHSLGGFAMPYLLRYLIDEYGLRGALLLTSGMTFQTLVFASLLRPAELYLPKKKQKTLRDKNCDFTQRETLLQTNYDTNGYLKTFSSSQPTLASENAGKDLRELMRKRTVSYSPGHANEMTSSTEHPIIKSFTNAGRYLSNGELVSLSLNDMAIIQKEQLRKSEQNLANNTKISSCFAEVFNFKLLLNKSLWIYLPVYLFGSVCPSFSSIYVLTFAKEQGVTDQQVANIASVLSLADCGGRIFVGYISDKSWVRRQKIVIMSQVLLGTLLVLNRYYTVYWNFLVFAVLFGSMGGTLFTLFSPIVIDMVGIKNFPNAMVILLMVQCVVISGMAPLLGYLRDLTLSYNATLYFMGGVSFMSAAIYSVQEMYITIKNRYIENSQDGSQQKQTNV